MAIRLLDKPADTNKDAIVYDAEFYLSQAANRESWESEDAPTRGRHSQVSVIHPMKTATFS